MSADEAIFLIVEGPGEMEAVPLLVRRLLYEHLYRFDLSIKSPYIAKGNGNLTRSGGIERFLEVARRASNPLCRGMLVLLVQ